MVSAVAVTAAEWLRAPGPAGAGLTVVVCALGALLLRPWHGWIRLITLAVLAGVAGAVGLTQRRLTLIEDAWPAQREARVEAASGRLRGDLHEAFQLAERLAARAVEVADGAQEVAFSRLHGLIPQSGVESGVAILDPNGSPRAWAGRQRLRPLATGDSLAVRTTGYYLVLETRRHSPGGRLAVAGVLIWAHPAVADRSRSLAELFRQRTEVGLEVYAPGAAPDSRNVFDYTEPTTAGDRLLFSTEPVPPTQAEARDIAAASGARVLVWLLLLLVGLGVALGQSPSTRLLALPAGAWLAVRAPIRAALGVHSPFSSTTYFLPLLGPVTSSAAALGLTGALVVVAALLWRPRGRWRVPRAAAGWLLAALMPPTVVLLGRGITPVAAGASLSLWIAWQLALFLPAAGMLLMGRAMQEGEAAGRILTPVIAGAAAALAGAGALVLWTPADGLPAWYPLLWIPLAIAVTLPASRRRAFAAIALVAGTLTAAVTWSEAVEGRLRLAERDVAHLGRVEDAAVPPLLASFETRVAAIPRVSLQSRMYTLWVRSPLAAERYPARLTLWTPAGAQLAELPLDQIGVPDSALARMVRELPPAEERAVERFDGVPGVHYVLVARLDTASVLTVAIGPRSTLVAPGRLGRLLHPSVARVSPQYRLELPPPALDAGARVLPWQWRRDGWSVRAERTLPLPGGRRQVRAFVELQDPGPALVRAALVMVLDLAVLLLLWIVTAFAAGGITRRLRWRQLLHSFRVQLTAALAAFFIIPTVAFTAWTFSHFQEEAERGRDLLIAQSLRDPALAAASLDSLNASVDSTLRLLGDRINADLAFYRGGSFVSASAPILRELGVLGPLMDPEAYQALALEGDLEATRDGAIPSLAERVGYRVIQPGPPEEVGVLASPQVAEVAGLGAPARQMDLALVLLLATLAGIGAAVLAAGRAGRALSRPVAELRRSALALGRGLPMPDDITPPPYEFEPVFGAFSRMAADISASRAALEAARRRTAAVLATVATGVVGLDPEGRVLIANRQAVELLGTPLEEGSVLGDVLADPWGPLLDAVREFLGHPLRAPPAAEFTVDRRRIALQIAPLGTDVSGVVLALNDVTDLSRAERVLAWGEMARQVAHEIKNPLTPLRLGIQHLQRAHRDRRPDFDRTLEETSERILSEIDRLDTIARAFSRFAAPGAEAPPLERLDLVAVATEVIQLYRLAGEGAVVELDAPAHFWARARRDEVKEVLVNLLENARNAGARRISVAIRGRVIRVADDGVGVPADQLPRIFEPRFSTTTSGSGLGLPIVRRLVEGWGGTIDVESEAGRGTVATVTLPE